MGLFKRLKNSDKESEQGKEKEGEKSYESPIQLPPFLHGSSDENKDSDSEKTYDSPHTLPPPPRLPPNSGSSEKDYSPSGSGKKYLESRTFSNTVDENNNLPPDAKNEYRHACIIGDKNSGKTTFLVLPLNERYENRDEYAKNLGLIRGEVSNVQLSMHKIKDHKGPYLDTTFAEGDYQILMEKFFPSIGVDKKPAKDVLYFDLVEIGGRTLDRMRSYHAGDREFKEELVKSEDADGFVKELKQVCETAINKIESYDENDTIVYFVDLSVFENTDEFTLKRRLSDVVENVSFLRKINPKPKLKFVLNRMDTIGGGKDYANSVYGMITWVLSKQIKDEEIRKRQDSLDNVFSRRILANPVPDSLEEVEKKNLRSTLDQCLEGTFYNVLSDAGISDISSQDFKSTYLLNSPKEINEEDSNQVWNVIFGGSEEMEGPVHFVIREAFNVLNDKIGKGSAPKVSGNEAEKYVRKAINNSELSTSISSFLKKDGFIKSMNMISDSGIVHRSYVGDSDPFPIDIVHGKRRITVKNNCDPIVPPTYELRDSKEFRDFVEFVSSGGIPISVFVSGGEFFTPVDLRGSLFRSTKKVGRKSSKDYENVVKAYNSKKAKSLSEEDFECVERICDYFGMCSLLERMGEKVPELPGDLEEPQPLDGFVKLLREKLTNYTITITEDE